MHCIFIARNGNGCHPCCGGSKSPENTARWRTVTECAKPSRAGPRHQAKTRRGTRVPPRLSSRRRTHRNVEALPHDASISVVGIRDDNASATGRTPRGTHPLVGYDNETWVKGQLGVISVMWIGWRPSAFRACPRTCRKPVFTREERWPFTPGTNALPPHSGPSWLLDPQLLPPGLKEEFGGLLPKFITKAENARKIRDEGTGLNLSVPHPRAGIPLTNDDVLAQITLGEWNHFIPGNVDNPTPRHICAAKTSGMTVHPTRLPR